MSRAQTGKCVGSTSGRHFWLVTTTEQDAERGENRYVCKNCGKEVLE
jgi:hypothetical protein